MVDCIGKPLTFSVGDEVEITNRPRANYGEVRKVTRIETPSKLMHTGNIRLEGLTQWFCACELKPALASPCLIVKV